MKHHLFLLCVLSVLVVGCVANEEQILLEQQVSDLQQKNSQLQDQIQALKQDNLLLTETNENLTHTNRKETDKKIARLEKDLSWKKKEEIRLNWIITRLVNVSQGCNAYIENWWRQPELSTQLDWTNHPECWPNLECEDNHQVARVPSAIDFSWYCRPDYNWSELPTCTQQEDCPKTSCVSPGGKAREDYRCKPKDLILGTVCTPEEGCLIIG